MVYHRLCRLHHRVGVVAVEVVLEMQLRPEMPVALRDQKVWMRPDDFDDADEEEDVDEDGEDRRNRQEVDAVPLIHPAELVLVHHSETCR